MSFVDPLETGGASAMLTSSAMEACRGSGVARGSGHLATIRESLRLCRGEDERGRMDPKAIRLRGVGVRCAHWINLCTIATTVNGPPKWQRRTLCLAERHLAEY